MSANNARRAEGDEESGAPEQDALLPHRQTGHVHGATAAPVQHREERRLASTRPAGVGAYVFVHGAHQSGSGGARGGHRQTHWHSSGRGHRHGVYRARSGDARSESVAILRTDARAGARRVRRRHHLPVDCRGVPGGRRRHLAGAPVHVTREGTEAGSGERGAIRAHSHRFLRVLSLSIRGRIDRHASAQRTENARHIVQPRHDGMRAQLPTQVVDQRAHVGAAGTLQLQGAGSLLGIPLGAGDVVHGDGALGHLVQQIRLARARIVVEVTTAHAHCRIQRRPLSQCAGK
eukprot:ctg_639.g272